MRRRLIPVLLLLLVFLTGCGKEKQKYGTLEVILDSPKAVILQEADGKKTAFRIQEDTWVSSLLEGVEPQDLREDMGVWVIYQGRRGCFAAPDGEKYPCYTARRLIIEEAAMDSPIFMSDGTRAWLWKGVFRDCYKLADKTPLLWVEVHPWQEQLDASDEVAGKIRSYFTEQGVLFDVNRELEKAYQFYLAADTEDAFQNPEVGQYTALRAKSSRVFYFCTTVTRPLTGQEMTEYQIDTAFDRETGEPIAMEDLFTCGRDKIMAAIYAASKLEDEELLAEMENAFRPEYLNFWPENLEVWFPAGSLSSYTTSFVLSVDMADIESVLEPWAVPISQE